MALFICHWGVHFLSTICYIFILPKTVNALFLVIPAIILFVIGFVVKKKQ